MVRVTGAAGSAGPSGVTDGGGAGVAGADTETRVTAGAGMTAGAEVGLANAVGRAQQGDAEAFRLLYRDIQPRLLRYLHAIAGQDAEDIASETWLQVTRDLPGFTGTYDGFRGWVATIARHRALDHLRRNTRRPPALAIPAEDLAAWPAVADTEQSAIDAVATGNAVALIATLPRTRPKPSCSAPSPAWTPRPQARSWANAPEPSAPPPTAASKPSTRTWPEPRSRRPRAWHNRREQHSPRT